MAITQRGTQQSAFSNTSVTEMTVSAPSGLAEGDVVIVSVCNQNVGAISTPSGLTEIEQTNFTAISLVVFYQVVGASPPASYTVAVPSGRSTITCSAWDGVDTSNPLDVTTPTGNTGSGAPTLPGITTATAGAEVFGVAGAQIGSGGVIDYTGTNADEFVGEVATNAGGGSNVGTCTVRESMPSTGSFTPTVTMSPTPLRGAGITFALRPAASAAEVAPNEASHAHTAESPAITQTHVVAPAEASHGHAADSPAITQTHVVAPAEASHGHAADSPAVTQVHAIVPADSSHGHTAESPTVTEDGGGSSNVTPDEATHAHTAESPAVTQVHVVAPDDATHTHATDAPTVTQTHAVTPADSLHGHTADEPAITQVHSLAPDDATHAHSADAPTVTTTYTINPDGSSHAHTADTPAVTQAHDVAPADGAHGHTANQPGVTQVHAITPDDALHAHEAESPGVFHNTGERPPASRSTKVPAENRTTTIKAENRTTRVALDDRTTAIAADNRTTRIPAENRTTQIR